MAIYIGMCHFYYKHGLARCHSYSRVLYHQGHFMQINRYLIFQYHRCLVQQGCTVSNLLWQGTLWILWIFKCYKCKTLREIRSPYLKAIPEMKAKIGNYRAEHAIVSGIISIRLTWSPCTWLSWTQVLVSSIAQVQLKHQLSAVHLVIQLLV